MKKARRTTRAQFWATLKKTSARWRLKRDMWGEPKFIRCAKGDCPITAVVRKLAGKGFNAHRYDAAAAYIGLDAVFASDVAVAADQLILGDGDKKAKLRAAIRKRLLKATVNRPKRKP